MISSSLSRFTIPLLLIMVACAGKPSQTTTPTSLMPVPTPTPDPGIITPENAQRLGQIKQVGMGEAIGSPIFSPDGKWIYQATRTGVFAFDTASYATSRLLAPYSGLGSSDDQQLMALSPDGNILAMGNDLVKADNGQKIASLDVPWPGTQAVAFSPDGSLLAREYDTDPSGSVARVGVWRLSDGSLLQTFPASPGRITELGFSTHGDYLSIPGTSKNSAIEVYDVKTGENVANWAGQQAVFLPDNQLAVETDGTIRIYDLGTGIAEHAFYGRLVGASPDGNLIAVLNFDQFKIYRISDEQLVGTLEAHPTSRFGATLRFSRDGQTLAVYAADYCCGGIASQSLSLWHLADSTLITSIDKVSNLFTFSPDGKTLAVTTPNASTQIFSTADGSMIASMGAYNLIASSVAFLSDGKQLAVSGVEDNTDHGMAYGPPIYFYDVDSGALIERQPANAKYAHFFFGGDGQVYAFSTLTGLPFGGWEYGGWGTTLSQDGKKAATAYSNTNGYSYGFDVWDLSTKAFLVSVSDLPAAVGSLSFSPDGQRLAIAFQPDILEGDFRVIQVRDATSNGQLLMQLNAGRGVSLVAFSPDGNTLAAGGSGGVVVWNVNGNDTVLSTSTQIGDFSPMQTEKGRPLAYSPDGHILAIGSVNGVLELWATSKGDKIFSVQVAYAVSSIDCVNFSPDGRLLAVGSRDGGVRIFGIK